MTKALLSFTLLVLAAPFAQAEDRQCRAILLMGGFEKPACQSADAALLDLSNNAWNTYVCHPEVQSFAIGGHQFSRDNSSGNLLSEDCEWEVRANSEGAK